LPLLKFQPSYIFIYARKKKYGLPFVDFHDNRMLKSTGFRSLTPIFTDAVPLGLLLNKPHLSVQHNTGIF